jgi:hypothetical protein
MSTAYKYVEREAEDQINWAEVGANLTGVLKEENRVREEKKGAIDEATRQFTQVLNDVPKGQNTELNKFALNAAADLQEQMLLQDKLLKSGNLKLRDFTIMRQNLTDGTDQAFSLFENYNAEYDIKMARMSTSLPVNKQASIIESWNMELVEGFGNFKDSKLVIDSRTGIMSMAKMIPDPNFKGTGPAPLIPDMNNLMSVQNMENRLKTQYDKYDVLGQAENYLDSLGTDERVFQDKMYSAYKADIFTTISDTTKKTEGGYASMSTSEKAELSRVTGVPINELKAISLFQESQDNWVKGQLGSGGIAGASVILDFRNKNPKTNEKFEPMMDSPKARELAKTDSNIVIMKNVDGRMVPELSEDQQIYAERILKSAINSGVDYKEDAKAIRQNFEETTTLDERKDNKALIIKQDAQSYWNQIKTANAADRVDLITAFLSTKTAKDAGLIGLVPADDGSSWTWTYDPSNKQKNKTIEVSKTITDRNWAGLGAEVTDLQGNDAYEAGGFTGVNTPYNPDFTGIGGANRQGNEIRYVPEFKQYLSDLMPTEGFDEYGPKSGSAEPFLAMEQKALSKSLNESKLGSLGLKAVPTGSAGNDNTQVTVDGWLGTAEYPAIFELDSDIADNNKANALAVEFQKWLSVAFGSKLESISPTLGFTGKELKYGPCKNGKKVVLANGLMVNC